MVGMLAAFGAEANTRAPILKQIQTSPVFVASAFALIILSSGMLRRDSGPHCYFICIEPVCCLVTLRQ